MGEIRDVTVGYVSTRRNARLHLVVGTRPHCNSGTGVVLTSRTARGDDAPHICKRCREALRSALVDVINVRERRPNGGRANATIVRACNDLIDGMTTGPERARQDAVLAEIAQSMSIQSGPATSPTPMPMTILPERDDTLTLF